MQKLQGFVEAGNTVLTIAGAAGTIARRVQGSFPSATITVYKAGTLTLATIYADNILTAKANPFTAGTDGTWFLYAQNGHYDVKFSGGGIAAPFTLGDFYLNDETALGIYNVLEYGAIGNGVTDDRAALNTLANTTIPNTGATLAFPPGTYKISSNITLPSYAALWFLDGAKLSIDTGVTVTINGPVQSPATAQIFSWSGTGKVVFAANSQAAVYPEWFGTVGNGSISPAPFGVGTDDEAAFLKAIDACTNGGHRFITQPGKTYRIGPLNAQSDALFLYPDNMVWDFGTSTFLANVFVVDTTNRTTHQPVNIIVNGGVYQPIGDNTAPTIPPATGRYTVGNNAVGVLCGKNVVFNNPRVFIMKRCGGFTLQTDATYTIATPKIENVQVDGLIVEGDTNPIGGSLTGVYGVEINALEDNYIRNVHVDSPIIRNVYQAVIVSSGSVAKVLDDISVTNVTAENISDVGFNIVGVRGGRFTGIVNGVGWEGCRSLGNSYCQFDLTIRAASTVAVPTGQSGTIAGLITQDATYANPGPNRFLLDIQGYSAGVVFTTGVEHASTKDFVSFANFKWVTTAIDNNVSGTPNTSVFDMVVINTVTNLLSSPNNTRTLIRSVVNVNGTTPILAGNRVSGSDGTAYAGALPALAFDAFTSPEIALNAAGTATPLTGADNFAGFIFVEETTTVNCAMFRTGAPSLVVQVGVNASWGVAAGSASYNVYFAGGFLTIQNNTGGARSFKVVAMRLGPSSS